ncbi:MAG TPA: carboxypeptidase-like regulatory domain-containing protein [Gemmataceae bacterium]
MPARLPLSAGAALGLALTLLSCAPAGRAAEPIPSAEIDKRAYDVLREIHNRGADLYNSGDPVGCYRLFQGALMAVRPMLEHQPAARKVLDSGMAAAEREPSLTKRAFMLHELIEQVRAEIRPAGAAPAAAKKPAAEAKGEPAAGEREKLDVVPKEVLPDGPGAEPPAAQRSPEPPAEGPDGPAEETAAPEGTGSLSGRVTYRGEPLANAGILFISSRADFRIYRGKTNPDGSYQIEQIPPGTYTVIFSPGGEKEKLPEKYTLTRESGLRAEVKSAGRQEVNFNLQ